MRVLIQVADCRAHIADRILARVQPVDQDGTFEVIPGLPSNGPGLISGPDTPDHADPFSGAYRRLIRCNAGLRLSGYDKNITKLDRGILDHTARVPVDDIIAIEFHEPAQCPQAGKGEF